MSEGTLIAVKYALLGTGITFLATVLGASAVFFFKNGIKPSLQRVLLGFAAGVMIAASVWSLLIPAINQSRESGQIPWLAAAGGFLLGSAFMLLLDRLLPHMHFDTDIAEGVKSKLPRSTLLVFAVTLHNIPEGMAVGLLFAISAQTGSAIPLASAFALAIGIGLQNIPEGAVISLPLKGEGFSRKKAFAYGALSGIVEPIAGVIAALLAPMVTPAMPWLLSFAAGAMIYVVVEELIPEANFGEHSDSGTIGVLSGFLLMMVLDLALV